MWYSKLAAVDTAPPAPAASKARSGIAAVSGNPVITNQPGGSDSVVLADFSIFGNVTQRDVLDAVLPIGIRGQFRNSVFDRIWIEHEFIGMRIDGDSDGVRISHSRVRDTLAGGIIVSGNTKHALVDASQSRSTGDDGIALWAQGATLDTISRGNRIQDSSASLQWYGNGFAIYGGQDAGIVRSSASDTLNFPCLQISSMFVPPSLPASASMSASASALDLRRCGGNGYGQKYGALLVAALAESLDRIAIDHVNIVAPSYRGIDIRHLMAGAGRAAAPTIGDFTIASTQVVGAPVCAVVGPAIGGAAKFTDVCNCKSFGAQPGSCTVRNASPGAFQVQEDACRSASCPSF
jgi:hypothetical protein